MTSTDRKEYLRKWYANRTPKQVAARKRYMKSKNASPESVASKRRWVESDRGRQVLKRNAANFRHNHPDRRRAHRAVEYALKVGNLLCPEQCSECCFSGLLNAHHDSYDKDQMLVVTWLCVRCHRKLHAEAA